MARKKKPTVRYAASEFKGKAPPEAKAAELETAAPEAGPNRVGGRRDPRKPQLGGRRTPLSSKQRRASSNERPAAEAPIEPQTAIESEAPLSEERPRWVPWGALGAAALVGVAVSGALPVAGGGVPWNALAGSGSALSTTVVGALLVCLMGGLWAASQRAYRVGLSDTMLPSFALLLSALSSGVIVGICGGGDLSPLAPMRGPLGGVPLEVWAGLLSGALLHRGERGPSRLTHRAAALGVVGLILNGWTPIGFAGQLYLPAWLALAGSSDLSAEAIQSHAWLSRSAPALLLSIAAIPGLFLLWRSEQTPRRWITLSAALTAAMPALLCLLSRDTNAAAHTLLALASTTLIATAVGVTLDRLNTRWDDENLVLIEWVAVAVILAVWLVAKVNGMGVSATDEGIYFYAAEAWSKGVWPYHDFFFSHPPIHILVPALLFAVFGFSLPLAKSLAIVAVAVASLFVWRIGRRFFSPFAGLVAMAAFLFAGEVLKSSANLTGINLTTMWAVIGLWAVLRGNNFRGGMLLAFAACTGFYSIGYTLILAVLTLFRPHAPLPPRSSTISKLLVRPTVRLVLGFTFIFGAINCVFYLLAGEDFLTGVYRYHFLKRAKLAGFTPLSEGLHAIPSNLLLMLQGHDFRVTLYYHGLQISLATLAPLGLATFAATDPSRKGSALPWLWNAKLWWQRAKDGGAVALLFLLAWGMLTEFAQFKERYDFYYTLVLPPFCLLAAAWLHYVWLTLSNSVTRDDAPEDTSESLPAPDPFFRVTLIISELIVAAVVIRTLMFGLTLGLVEVGLVAPLFGFAMVAGLFARARLGQSRRHARRLAMTLLLTSGAWVPLCLWANNSAWKSEVTATSSSRGAGEVLRFDWTDAPGPAWLSSLTKATLWKGHRVRGSLESGLHHYLWSKKRSFSTAPEIARYIRDNSKPSDTITGASTYAPMVALLADRRMAADHVDTNSKTFKTGVVTPPEFWERACSDDLKFIIAGPRSYFSARAMRRRPTISRQFKLVEQYRDSRLKHWRDVTLELWERRPDVKACRYIGKARRKR